VYISEDLVDWLFHVQKQFDSKTLRYRVYEYFLLKYLVNDRSPYPFTMKEITQEIGTARETLGAYIRFLKTEHWIQYQRGHEKVFTLSWVRTTLSEKQPRFPAAGVRVKAPDGKIYSVPIGKFTEFEREHGLPHGFIVKLKEYFTNGLNNRKGWSLTDIVG
jgi:hypothetical protein